MTDASPARSRARRLPALFLALAWAAATNTSAQVTSQSAPGAGNLTGDAVRDAAAAIRVTAPRIARIAPAAPPSERAPFPGVALHAMSTYVVTTIADTGAGSLRKAIQLANNDAALDLITFAIPGSGVHTITPLSALPVIAYPVIIDGTTQAGYAGSPLIEITGVSAGANVNGLNLQGGGSTVKALNIHSFVASSGLGGMGIVLDVKGGDTVQGCWIGTGSTGAYAMANGGSGISMVGASGGNVIGGTTAATRNVVSGNAVSGIQCSTGNAGGNVIVGNYVGLNAAGTAIVANGGNGIFCDAPNDTIGGAAAGAGNIVSGNAYPGIYLGPNGPRNVLRGNFIGTDATGALDLGNVQNGIFVDRSPNNVIGDSTTAGRNVISGNDSPGVYIQGAAATGNLVRGNYIGCDAAGVNGLGDGNGVIVDAANDNVIGGTTAGTGNLVSGSPFPAVVTTNGAARTRIAGNWIGVSSAGTAALANSKGVLVNACPNTIIGGTTANERNVISGNTVYGVEIRGAASTGNRVSGNFIGTDTSGVGALGNGVLGVIVNASNDTIGGTTAAYGNVIAYNKGPGVYDSTGTGTYVRYNSIFSNTALGIDIYPRGITANDSLDTDAGVNDLQNFPALDSVLTSAGGTRVVGHLDSRALARYTVDVYHEAAPDTLHFGGGRAWVGSALVATDSTGHATFAVTNAAAYAAAEFFTATATDSLGSTSEFSQAFSPYDRDGDGLPDMWETQNWGLDVNSDGKIDLDLWTRGARPDHKDLFVEWDAMLGYAPPAGAVDSVVAAFARVKNTYVNNPDGLDGVKLHVDSSDVAIPVVNLPNSWSDVAPIKQQWFGTVGERANANARWIRLAKLMTYRWGLWSRTYGTIAGDTCSSGLARVNLDGTGGPDFLVTFGSTGANGWNNTRRWQDHAGTFMHEFGHTLGLFHGGADHVQDKPNYYSVMNYLWQVPNTNFVRSWRLDYSPVKLPDLNEARLVEATGLGVPAGVWPAVAMPFSDKTGAISYTILGPMQDADWNGDLRPTASAVSADINQTENILLNGGPTPSPNEVLSGYADWPHLAYNLRAASIYTPDFNLRTPWLKGASATESELTPAILSAYQKLPPPQPRGRFVMDGKLDARARLIASNGGVNLYAACSGSQLYVATSSAQSLGADVCIAVANVAGALQSPPMAKGGKMGAWCVALTNRAADNSCAWVDSLGATFSDIAVDTAGTVLEGVIDMDLQNTHSNSQFLLAVGRWSTAGGGALTGQVPAGNGDANLDANEYVTMLATVDVPAPATAPGPRLRFGGVRPNPAPGPARVSFELGEAADVRVAVLDVMGRTVAVLADGRLAAGAHDLAWDPARDGRRAAPGVYFVEVKAFGETRTARFVRLD